MVHLGLMYSESRAPSKHDVEPVSESEDKDERPERLWNRHVDEFLVGTGSGVMEQEPAQCDFCGAIPRRDASSGSGHVSNTWVAECPHSKSHLDSVAGTKLRNVITIFLNKDGN
jgi:hypothetical protein